MKQKMKPIVDDRNYSVVSINGFRRGNLTLPDARTLAARMREQMRTAGWSGEAVIYYRDGTEVKDEIPKA